MRQDQLICASCSGRVFEGRCPVCREARSDLLENNKMTVVAFLLAVVAVFALVFGLVRGFA